MCTGRVAGNGDSRGLGRAAGESELVLLWSDAGELDTGGRARWQLGWSTEADEEHARGSVIVKRKITVRVNTATAKQARSQRTRRSLAKAAR